MFGADSFVFGKGGTETIQDFDISQADKLDLSSILTGYRSGSHITDFLSFTTSGGNTTVSIDANGLTGGLHFVAVGTLTGVTGLSVQSLFDAGQIIP